MDLTETDNIKKRWQKYTEELHKKDLHDPDNRDCMITHLEPDILECEVKWTLGSITMNKATGGEKYIQGIRSNRVPEELGMEVHDVVQEAGIKTIPKKKKCRKAKWLSKEALQIAVKRKKAKGKGEKERYTHLNAEFQRTARKNKKAFLSDKCKKNRQMCKSGDLSLKSV